MAEDLDTEGAPRTLSRPAAFIRSLLPAQTAHLLFVLGSLLLYGSAFASWVAWQRLLTDQPSLRPAAQSWSLFAALPIRVFLLVASLSALWICFRPGDRPTRRILTRVFAPVLVSLVWFFVTLICILLLNSPRSVLEAEGDAWQKGFASLSRLPSDLGAGFYFGVAGLLLLGMGIWRLNGGFTALPVQFEAKTSAAFHEEAQEGAGARAILVFGSLTLVLSFALPYLFGLVIVLLPMEIFRQTYGAFSWPWAIDLLLGSSAPALGALYVHRHDLRAQMRRVFELSSPPYYGMALVLPVLALGVPQLVFYLAARRPWVPGALSPVESVHQSLLTPAWVVTLLMAALLEEIGWRGYLQPRLVDRLGVRRGIFLVGLIWGAFHLSGELNGASSLGPAATRLGTRLALCVALAVTFGWLRLYSGSFLPVVVLHATHNILIQNVETFRFPLRPPAATWANLVAWSLIGYFLFKYRPPREAKQASPVPAAP